MAQVHVPEPGAGLRRPTDRGAGEGASDRSAPPSRRRVRAGLRRIVALVRVDALSAMSYRLRMVLALGGLVFSFVPLFFVAEALQPIAAESIRDEGERYFAFLMIGLAVTAYVDVALRSLPDAIEVGIDTGVLEALLTTPAWLPELLTGLITYKLLRTSAQAVLFLAAIVVAGGQVTWGGLPLGLLILALIFLAHLGIGLVGAALHLAFRTSGPLLSGTLALSTLLGGVYYSTTVIPEVIRPLASLLPLTYGLRAFRQSVLQGAAASQVAADIGVLAAFALVLLALGVWALGRGLRHARRAGTLAQY